MMRLAILAGLLALPTALPTAAWAEGKATVAECGDGGCRCRLSALTAAEIEAATGVPAPAEADSMTLVAMDGTFVWSRLTGDEADMLMGGDGICALELFPEIVPRDGIWTPVITGTTIAGCPAGLEALLDPALAGVSDTARPVRWGGAFAPEKMAIGPSGVQWQRTGPRAFRGTVRTPGSDVASVGVTADTRLQAEDKALGTIVLQVTARAGDAAGQAALRAAGMADCRAEVAFEFNRTGD